MTGYATFEKAVIEIAKQHYLPAVEANRDEFQEAFKNSLFDLDGPRQVNRQVSAWDIYVGRVFNGFLEISRSLEALDDIAFYIRRFPFAQTNIRRERYLQFHVEAHYSEIYILKERMLAYSVLFRRQFRRDPRLQGVEQRCEDLNRTIDRTLNGVVTLRGRHVHELRFSDENIDRLSTISLLLKGEADELSRAMLPFYQEEWRRIRTLWRDTTRNNVKVIRELLDVYFDELFSMVFENDPPVLRRPHGVRI